ncbi:MAG: isomerase [Robiginitomaculum sp.]|nr:MAG: isomerase [Robiginitomaculum sp.]
MKLELYQIDAFADAPFSGNPAAVVPLDHWLDDAVLQNIAMENNLAETAFIVPTDAAESWKLRWFTPTMEVPLCGHATLASAACIMRYIHPELNHLRFATKSGELQVQRVGEAFVMDLPAGKPKDWTMPEDALAALGVTIIDSGISTYPFVVLKNEQAVRALNVQNALKATRLAHSINELVVCAEAEPGTELDFVLRFFAPGVGVDEDPVTGSAITYLTPYWAKRLGKTKMRLYQASPRGGYVSVEVIGDRVRLGGKARDYLRGTITL